MSAVAIGALDTVKRAGVGSRFRLVTERGEALPFHVERWFGEPDPAEEAVLARAVGPVLDAGCGPARHTLALLRRGVPALGVDVAPSAVRLAERRGAPVLHRSVFDRLPLEGAWGSVLLLDGNVGIGGDPRALFIRVREILCAGGRVLVEVDPPGTPTERVRVAIEFDGSMGPWFAWARVGADGLEEVARQPGLALRDEWTNDGRWFAWLDAC